MIDIEKLKEKIRLAKFEPVRFTQEWPYHTGFNNALEFVERNIMELERGETDERTRAGTQQRSSDKDREGSA